MGLPLITLTEILFPSPCCAVPAAEVFLGSDFVTSVRCSLENKVTSSPTRASKVTSSGLTSTIAPSSVPIAIASAVMA